MTLALCEEALAGRRRVLGNAHLHTLDSVIIMALVRDAIGEHAVAATLMREALAGRRRVLGEDHPHTEAAIAAMDEIEEKLRSEEVGAAEEEEEDDKEETVHERLAKRHRRA